VRGSYDKQRRTKRFSVNTAGKRYFYAGFLQRKRCQEVLEGFSRFVRMPFVIYRFQGFVDRLLIVAAEIPTIDCRPSRLHSVL
jgi:hypothetical protein